jgi:hypothetical protein
VLLVEAAGEGEDELASMRRRQQISRKVQIKCFITGLIIFKSRAEQRFHHLWLMSGATRVEIAE